MSFAVLVSLADKPMSVGNKAVQTEVIQPYKISYDQVSQFLAELSCVLTVHLHFASSLIKPMNDTALIINIIISCIIKKNLID